VQVVPVKPTLIAPGTKRLKLLYDKLLSNFAFNFSLHRYTLVLFILFPFLRRDVRRASVPAHLLLTGRGLHSSTFWLNVSAFCGVGGAFRGCLGGV
jgi:hypothetical protein